MSGAEQALAPVAVEGGLIAGIADVRRGQRQWLGVPYAAAPVGELRWRPPAPVAPWSGVRAADRLAPQCVQPRRVPESVYAEYAGEQPMSEDCLYLNVFAPSEPPAAALPVMVWIHGGAFQQGAGSNPVFVQGDLPGQGVVLVTLNYRLGPFGFLAHPALTRENGGASGNWGLLDIVAALEWVQRHIERFGGDPGRVTVFGQSAGAHAVTCLLAAPRARGLFVRAIAHSFGLSPMPTRAEGEAQGERFVRRVLEAQGPGADPMRALAALRAMDAQALLERYLEQPERFMPIADGALLAQALPDVFAQGRQQPLPLLIGWNRDEGTAFAPPASDLAAFRAQLRERFQGERLARAERLYTARDDAQARAASRMLFGDGLFGAGVLAAARAQARIAPTYLYHFVHAQPFAAGQHYREADPASTLGAFHSAEYPYLFGSTRVLTREWSDDDDAVTRLMQRAWVAFARGGDPNTQGVPAWPEFTHGTASVMLIGPDARAVELPQAQRLSLFDQP
ncbi:MAG: carboxylesterase family protein [Xenophilus sp.]